MNQIRGVIDAPNVIPREVLSDLGRRSLKEVVQDGPAQLSFDELTLLWSRLQWTACNSTVVDKHLTEACNAVCVFLYSASWSTVSRLKAFVASEQVWFQGFEVVHKAFGDGKNKPALQVLETLIQVLCDHDSQQAATAIIQKAVCQMIDVILTGQPTQRLKEACIVLSCFLKRARDIVPVTRYFVNYGLDSQLAFRRRCKQANVDVDLLQTSSQNPLSHLLMALLLTTSISESRTAAIKLFSLLCSKSEKLDYSSNIDVASPVIEIYLQSNGEAFKDFSADVLPAVLSDREQVRNFLNQFDPSKNFSVSRLSVYLAILQVGRLKGTVSETGTELPSILNHALCAGVEAANPMVIEYIGFQRLLTSSIPAIRLQAYNLLTCSNATNATVPLGALRCLTQMFKHLHDETDASYRDEYLSISRRFIKRLERSGHIAQRLITMEVESEHGIQASYLSFLQGWNSFLIIELMPNISYPRHALALSVLRLTLPLTSSTPGIVGSKMPPSLVPALLSLLFDPFEDVRIQASTILVNIASNDAVVISSALRDFNLIERGQQMSASTNRADHADALGRLLMLQAFVNDKIGASNSLKNEVALSQSFSINNATCSLEAYLSGITHLDPSSKYPLHGNLLGIAHTLRLSGTEEKWSSERIDLSELFNISSHIWSLVQSQLCVDSPETEVEEEEQSGLSGPKDLLAYSWRALRDSSLMMQALLDTVPSSFVLYQQIGHLCFEQLARLRHRGAFSTVAQTFYLCCSKSRSSNDNHCRSLGGIWLEAAFDEVDGQSLKLTRRSAGLPSMFAALLDPYDQVQFRHGMYRLGSIANRDSERNSRTNSSDLKLPQVHALNSLKDVMTNSRFRVMTEPLVVEMLNLATKCLSSTTWAIRNCGLMLFRACINRLTPDSSNIYGSDKAGIDGVGIQTPLALAIQLLQNFPTNEGKKIANNMGHLNETHSEIVFAALDLLSHIPFQPETYKTIDNLVAAQLSSRIWAIREHAARLRASRSTDDHCLQVLESSLPTKASASSNTLHGHLLCRRYMFNKYWPRLDINQRISQLPQLMDCINEFVTTHSTQSISPVVLAALLDWLNDAFCAAMVDGVSCNSIVQTANRLRKTFVHYVRRSDMFLFRRAYALNCVYAHLYDSTSVSLTKDGPNGWEDDLWHEHDIAKYVVDEVTLNITDVAEVDVFGRFSQVILEWDNSDVWAMFMLGSIRYMPTSKTVKSFSEDDLVRSLQRLDFRLAEDRGLWNAKIKYAGALIHVLIQRGSPIDQVILRDFLSALRLSQQDEVEAPTRLYAVLAVADIVPTIKSSIWDSTNENIGPNKLCLVFLLYDFLNDDDDEIREIAVNAIHTLNDQAETSKQLISGCAVAARNSVLQILSRHVDVRSDLITAGACIRLLGVLPIPGQDDMKTLITFCQTMRMQHIIEEQLQHASDLFAKERQNLYIDDIAQIEACASIVHLYTFDDVKSTDLDVLVMWTIEGLLSLSKLIEQTIKTSEPVVEALASHTDAVIHPLGLTYDAEFLILFVRVVTMAGLLRETKRTKGATANASNVDTSAITEQLYRLRAICLKCHVHQLVLTTIQASLAD